MSLERALLFAAMHLGGTVADLHAAEPADEAIEVERVRDAAASLRDVAAKVDWSTGGRSEFLCAVDVLVREAIGGSAAHPDLRADLCDACGGSGGGDGALACPVCRGAGAAA